MTPTQREGGGGGQVIQETEPGLLQREEEEDRSFKRQNQDSYTERKRTGHL